MSPQRRQKILALAAQFYMDNRKNAPPEVQRRPSFGWAARSGLRQYLLSRGIPAVDAYECGLLVIHRTGWLYDWFRDRAVYVCRKRGKIVDFMARAVPDHELLWLRLHHNPRRDMNALCDRAERAWQHGCRKP